MRATSIDKIQALMEEAGMNQKETASAIGVSESTMSRLLAGEIERELSVPEAAAFLEEVQKRLGRKRGLTLNDIFGKAA